MADNLLIKSRDRTSGTSSNFLIASSTYNVEGEYLLKYALVPNGFYNVNSQNSTFQFDEGAGLITVSLTQGNYDVTTLSTLVANALTTASGAGRTYSASIGAASNRITISNDLSGDTSLDFSLQPRAANLLGFSTSTVAAIHPVVGDQAVDLSSPSSIGILINQASERGYDNIGSQNCGTFYIPLNQAFGSYVSLSPHDLPQIATFKRTRILQIRLVDTSSGEPLDLNGLNFELLLIRTNANDFNGE